MKSILALCFLTAIGGAVLSAGGQPGFSRIWQLDSTLVPPL